MIAMNASVVEAGCGWRGSWAADAAMPRTQRRRRRAMREDCTAAALQHGAETFSSAAARHRHRALGRGGAMCGGGGCRAMPPIVGFCPRCAPSCPAVQMRAGGRDHSEVGRAATMYAPDLCQSTRATPNLVARLMHSTIRRVKPQAAPTWSFRAQPASLLAEWQSLNLPCLSSLCSTLFARHALAAGAAAGYGGCNGAGGGGDLRFQTWRLRASVASSSHAVPGIRCALARPESLTEARTSLARITALGGAR